MAKFRALTSQTVKSWIIKSEIKAEESVVCKQINEYMIFASKIQGKLGQPK